MYNQYDNALDSAIELASIPYSEEIAKTIKDKPCFKVLREACEKAEQFDTLKASSIVTEWHIIKENDLPKYSSDDFLIVTIYEDNCDYPYYETTVARFYKTQYNNVTLWISGDGSNITSKVVAWKELPTEYEYVSYKENLG